MFAPGTVLQKKELLYVDAEGKSHPLSEFKPKNKEDKPTLHPYNEIKVLGQSPVVHPGAGEWEGVYANGVIVAPLTEFAMTVDQPFGLLQRLYKVIAEPPAEPEETVVRVKNPQAQPTPEMVFDAHRPPGEKKSETRVRTPMPSDGDPGDPALKSPLE